jgi:hypothetical protein
MQANEESKRGKSRTEFIKRDRQESEDSAQNTGNPENEQRKNGVDDDVSTYLNTIVPNNSIKFAKPTQSVSSLSNKKYIEILILNKR